MALFGQKKDKDWEDDWPEEEKPKTIFGFYKYEDPHMGYGFDGWVKFLMAESEEKAVKESGLDPYVYGMEKLDRDKLDTLRNQEFENLRQTLQRLEDLNRILGY